VKALQTSQQTDVQASTRALGADYVEALQRQTGQRNVFISWSWSVVPELAPESPSNFAFLCEREVTKIRRFGELPPD
jgi:hypothetical protein